MPSSTSNSEVRFFAALGLTFAVLFGAWELVLRQHAGATANLAFGAPPARVEEAKHDQILIFGNCLMMTGVSPRRLESQMDKTRDFEIVNIAAHEQSPLAFFDYLRKNEHYPNVIVTNVSSWLNGTNFEQEGELVTKNDPLKLGKHDVTAHQPSVESFRQENESESGRTQRAAEAWLTRETSDHSQVLAHRYHLFDFTLFMGALARTRNFDDALYQLNMQSWFKVRSTETDGLGFLALEIDYREDWPRGLDRMAERSLQRLRLSRLLTEKYWSLLEADVREFQGHGTQVMFVRMPEHPAIREFNESTYEITRRMKQIEAETGAPFLDLSMLGPKDGVRLFDAVHPDAEAAEVISQRVGEWLRGRRLAKGAP